MKTKEELKALKDEYENLSSKLRTLDEDELAQVTGGAGDIRNRMDALLAVAKPVMFGGTGIIGGIGPKEAPSPFGPTQVRCRKCHTSYPYATRTNYCGFCGAKDWCTDLDPEFFDF